MMLQNVCSVKASQELVCLVIHHVSLYYWYEARIILKKRISAIILVLVDYILPSAMTLKPPDRYCLGLPFTIKTTLTH